MSAGILGLRCRQFHLRFYTVRGGKDMNRVFTFVGVSGLVLALSFPSWAQVTQSQTITLSGTVETVDQSRRTLNIKKTDGTFETVEVPTSAKRFDELKVGDKVTVTYNNTVSARLKPPGEAAVD